MVLAVRGQDNIIKNSFLRQKRATLISKKDGTLLNILFSKVALPMHFLLGISTENHRRSETD